jgi:HK97 family phage major capsid protein
MGLHQPGDSIMASRLSTLRFERERIAAQAKELNEKYPDGTRMPKEESTRLDGLLDKLEGLDRDIGAIAEEGQQAGWRVDGKEVPVLRSERDIRRYYNGRTDGRSGSSSISSGLGDATLTDFVRGIAGMQTTDGIRAALSEGTNTAGGHLVPSVMMPGILEALVPASAVLSAGAGIIPTEEGAKTYTQAAIDAIPTAAWRDENGDIAESEPTFRAVAGTPRSLAFFFKVSRELLADAANVEPALVLAISQAFAKALDLVALRGTGAAPQPRGILNTAGIGSVTNGAAGASLATTKYANFFSAVQALLEADAPMPTAAIMSPRSHLVLGQLVDTTGQPLQVSPMLADVKMLHTTQIPNNLTVGGSTDCSEIYVGDFSRMAILMRERLSIQRADQLFATKGQVGFICHVRADVLVQYAKAFAVVTGVRP